jgi:hypothetical protein
VDHDGRPGSGHRELGPSDAAEGARGETCPEGRIETLAVALKPWCVQIDCCSSNDSRTTQDPIQTIRNSATENIIPGPNRESLPMTYLPPVLGFDIYNIVLIAYNCFSTLDIKQGFRSGYTHITEVF